MFEFFPNYDTIYDFYKDNIGMFFESWFDSYASLPLLL